MKAIGKMVFLIGLSLVSFKALAWSGQAVIKDIYFEGGTPSSRMVIIFDQPLHACGWNQAVHIERPVVGEELFRQYMSVVLTAFSGQFKLRVSIHGCSSDRGQGHALMLSR